MEIKRLFVCCTPYQVFNSINIAYQLGLNNGIYDIVICNHFTNSKKVFEGCKEASIWNNCYYMKSEFERGYIETLKVIHTLNYPTMIEGDAIFKWDYDEVYIGTFNNISSIIVYKYCKKYNKKLIIFDEGLASYTISDFARTFSKKQRLFRKVIGHVIDPKFVEMLLLYHPEWYCGSYQFNIKPIQFIDRNNQEMISKINMTFKYKKSHSNNTKFIFFDQPIVINNSKETYKNTLMKVASIFKKYNIDYDIIWHPRTDDKFRMNYKKSKVEQKSLGGWELELLSKADDNSKVYVTPFSTAAVLGKMLFNENDTIILLYKILNIKNEYVESFFTKIKSRSDNIYIPENWDEFENILKKIRNSF